MTWTRHTPLITLLTALVLAGCASTTDKGRGRTVAPADLMQVPDAQPRVEVLRSGGPNKPYAVLGRSYTPLTTDEEVRESGLASWYGGKFHGLRTASGEVYDMHAMTAAHPTMPIPSYARVRNPANGRAVVVRVNDRGPFTGDRSLDLSRAAASALGILNRGTAQVELLLESSADKLGAVTSLLNSAVACNN